MDGSSPETKSAWKWVSKIPFSFNLCSAKSLSKQQLLILFNTTLYKVSKILQCAHVERYAAKDSILSNLFHFTQSSAVAVLPIPSWTSRYLVYYMYLNIHANISPWVHNEGSSLVGDDVGGLSQTFEVVYPHFQSSLL